MEAIMGNSASLVVEMIDDTIVVTMPGTDFFASYRKRQGASALAAHFPTRRPPRTPAPLRVRRALLAPRAPEEIAANKASYTGHYLKQVLERRPSSKAASGKTKHAAETQAAE